jgi:hypothetical protein
VFSLGEFGHFGQSNHHAPVFFHSLSTWLLSPSQRSFDTISNAYIRTCRYDSAFIGGTIELPAFQAQFGLDKLSEGEIAFTSSNIVSTYQAGESNATLLNCLQFEYSGLRC